MRDSRFSFDISEGYACRSSLPRLRSLHHELAILAGVIVVIPLLYSSALIGEKTRHWLVQHGIAIDQIRWLIDFVEKNPRHGSLIVLLTAALGLMVVFGGLIILLYAGVVVYTAFTDQEGLKMHLKGMIGLLLIGACLGATGLVVVAVLKWAWKTVFSG